MQLPLVDWVHGVKQTKDVHLPQSAQFQQLGKCFQGQYFLSQWHTSTDEFLISQSKMSWSSSSMQAANKHYVLLFMQQLHHCTDWF